MGLYFAIGMIALTTTLFLLRPLLLGEEFDSSGGPCDDPSSEPIDQDHAISAKDHNQASLKDEYRRRIADIDRDEARGLISEEDGEIARVQISRQLSRDIKELEAHDMKTENARKPLGKKQHVFAIALIGILPILAFALYFFIGNPELEDQPIKERLAQNEIGGEGGEPVRGPNAQSAQAQEGPSDKQIEQLIEQVKLRLEKDPEDEEGWAILARTFSTLKRNDEAAKAWAGLLKVNPDHSDGLWFSGVYAAQNGKPDEARTHWLKLQSRYNPDSDDYDLINQALATLN